MRSIAAVEIVPAPPPRRLRRVASKRGLVDHVGQVGAGEAGGQRRRPAEVDAGRRAASCARAPPGSARRPLRSGRSTSTCRSKRPARSNAGSSISGRLVAASRITPCSGRSRRARPAAGSASAPSRRGRRHAPAPRLRPSASSSSMKMMQGAALPACSNRSRTRAAPTPTNISTNSAPEMREERHAGLAGDGARQQRLAGAGRADQQNALRDARAEPAERCRVAQEGDDFLQLDLGLVDAGHVVEGHLRVGLDIDLGARLADRHQAAETLAFGMRRNP